MKSFNVIIYNYNAQKFEHYDIMPYLIRVYQETHKPKPITIEEFKEFIKKESMYQWWSRCEYEIILSDWPCQNHKEKWDIYNQVMMNLDIIANILMENIKNDK